jgi:YD repeat-containing protein
VQSTFGNTGLRSRACKAFLWSQAVVVAVLSSWAFLAGESQAGQERYDYDPIGRLVRYTDSSNQVTEYIYDAAGNILAVTRGSATGQAPVLSGISPSVIRRGEAKALTLTGQRLQSGSLQTADLGLDLSNLRQSASQLLVDVSAAESTPVGNHTLTFSNSLGSAHIALAVGPKLPTLSIEPSPLALPPDNVARAITLRLSNSDVISHTVGVASSDTSKATVSPASVTIAAGQTSAQVNVTPKVSGFATLTMSSPTLQTATVPVFVTSDFRGVNTSTAPAVGVVVGTPEPTGPSASSATFVTPRVGIAVGPILTGVTPSGMVVGANHNLVVTGTSIPGTVQVSIVPAQDVTATWAVEPAGDRIAVALNVDASAATGARRLVVKDGAGNLIPFADPARSQLMLTAGQPSIASITPLFATPGTSPKILVRGANLQNGRLVVSPSIDLRVDSEPSVNAAGTELVAGIQIAPLAAAGARVLQVATPSGESTSQANSANQLTIVSEIKNDVTPIFAPVVGVVVGASTGGQGTTTVGPVQSPHVGLIVGAAAYWVTPSVGVLGTTVNLVVSGVGLQSVQTATLAGPSGVSVGSFTVNAEGTQLTIPVTIDANAPRGARRVTLVDAAGKLVFSPSGADQFQVVAPAPELISIAPQVLAAGTVPTLTVRGKNFTDVTGVQFDPPTGMTPVLPFTVSEGNTVLSFAVQVGGTAPTGMRTVIVNTAGGPSTAVPSPANTVQVAQQVGPTYSSIVASNVGVTVGASAPPQATDTIGVHAPLVGVVFGSIPAEGSRTDSVYANNVGVVVGVAATGISPRSPDGYLKGSSGSLAISGFALDQVTAVTVTGSAGVSLGALSVDATGTQLTVPVTVSPTAASTSYGIRLSTGSGTATVRVTAAEPAAMLFSVGSLPTAIDSVSPIVLEQGKSYTFTVRGSNLKDVVQLVAEPDAGITFGVGLTAPQWSTDSFGEKLTVPLLIDSNAAIGSRVVRFRAPGGITGPDATPSNTITIVAPQ